MTSHRRSLPSALAGAALLFVLLGCASGPAASSAGMPAEPESPALPDGEVIGQGTVMDVSGTVEFCLGGVAESYPPQCSGIPLTGWSWEGIDGAEATGDVTWGAYALTGAYDGDAFSVTQPPIMLALYDPAPFPDPTGGRPGNADEETLAAIVEEVPRLVGDDFLSSGTADGWVHLHVVWDDGTWQDVMDATYGEGMVAVSSALRLVEG